MKWRGDTVNTVTQGGIVGSFRDYLMHSDVEDVDLFKKVGQEETIG